MRDDDPILVRMWRGGQLESLHRGAWVLVDRHGTVLDGAGDAEQLVFPRSASKSLQALPLVESGAAEAFGFDDRNLALALASHSGEAIHTDVAADGLGKLGLDEGSLRCGPQRPFDAGIEAEATRIRNNCSGKHTGFLAVARHLGDDPADYLDPSSATQQRVAAAVAELTDTPADVLSTATDGCSAPTFHLPLRGLATGLARVADPRDLAPERAAACRRLTTAARAHPELVAGTNERLCTDLLRATDGRIFPKIGAEAVYTFGVVDGDRGFACKIDDGGSRALAPLVVALLRDQGLLDDGEVEALGSWASTVIRNWDGIEVGSIEVTLRP